MNKYGLHLVMKLASCYGLKASAQGSGKKQFVVVGCLNSAQLLLAFLTYTMSRSYQLLMSPERFDAACFAAGVHMLSSCFKLCVASYCACFGCTTKVLQPKPCAVLLFIAVHCTVVLSLSACTYDVAWHHVWICRQPR